MHQGLRRIILAALDLKQGWEAVLQGSIVTFTVEWLELDANLGEVNGGIRSLQHSSIYYFPL